MMRVRTFLQKSDIAGIGLFAAAYIPKGTVTWIFDDGIDLILPIDVVEALPQVAKTQISHYGYIYFNTKSVTLCADDARFMNHSDNPNTESTDNGDIAIRDIEAGEEITCDYYKFDEDAVRKLGTSKSSA